MNRNRLILILLPKTKEAWARLALFPFKAYIVLAPICYFGWLEMTEGQRAPGARAYAAESIEAGLAICLAGLLAAALIQLMTRRYKDVLVSFAWALITFLLVVQMAPFMASSH